MLENLFVLPILYKYQLVKTFSENIKTDLAYFLSKSYLELF